MSGEHDKTDDGDELISREEILKLATEIAREYQADGLTLTLRQLYYRFVALGYTGSGNRVYKRIGAALTAARYAGTFPIDWIEDRGREVAPGDFTRVPMPLADSEADARTMIRALPSFLVRRARWSGQSAHVSVWVEKQALEGVFAPVCADLGVSLFACKGYPSVSSLYDWLRGAYFAVHGEHPDGDHAIRHRRRYTMGSGFDWSELHRGTADECVVLYFGDHDPDGWEIPRSSERGLRTLMASYGLDVPLRFERIAMNMDQVSAYNPPPFEAKVTSARYRSYVEEHDTEDAWELDALEPKILRRLIRDSVAGYFRERIHEQNRSEVAELRASLRAGIAAGIHDVLVEDDDAEDDGGDDSEE